MPGKLTTCFCMVQEMSFKFQNSKAVLYTYCVFCTNARRYFLPLMFRKSKPFCIIIHHQPSYHIVPVVPHISEGDGLISINLILYSTISYFFYHKSTSIIEGLLGHTSLALIFLCGQSECLQCLCFVTAIGKSGNFTFLMM